MKKFCLQLLHASIILLISASLPAQTTCTWLGGNGNWNDPTKWSCGVVPGEEHEVVINSGTVTGNFFLQGETPDEIIIYNLILNGGILETGSNIFVVGNFDWRGGRFRGSPEADAHLYNGGHITVDQLFNMSAATGVDSLVFVNKSMSVNGGGIWNNAPDLVLKNAKLSMVPFYGYDPALRLITTTRDSRVTGYNDPANPYSTSCYLSLVYMAKTGSGRFTFEPPQLKLDDNYFNINEGNLGVVVNDNQQHNINSWMGEPNTNIDIVLKPAPGNTTGGYFRNLSIYSLGKVNIIADDPALTTQLLTFSGTLTADTLNIAGKYNSAERAIITHAGHIETRQLMLSGPLNCKNGMIQNYSQSRGSGLFVYDGILYISKATFTGGRLGGFLGTILTHDSLFVTGPDSLFLVGTRLFITGYAKFKNFKIPVGSLAYATLPDGLPLPPFTMIAPNASDPYPGSSIWASANLLEMEIDTNSGVFIHFPASPAPYSTSFTNNGTIKIFKPGGGSFATFHTDLPFTNNAIINGSYIDMNTASMDWKDNAEFSGRMNVNVNGTFNFSNTTTTPARLNTAKLNLFGAQNFFDAGNIDMNATGGILTNYGTVTTLCNNGSIHIFNSSGDGRGYFSNYGQLVKTGLNSTISFRSDVLLKNGRDMIIQRGIVKSTAAFNNLNLIRGYGKLDISEATSVSNTGTLTGGVTLTGELTVQGNFENSTYIADIKGDNPGGGPPADKLIASGSIDIAGSKLVVRERGNVPTGSSFVIMECQGSNDCLTGTFATHQLPADYIVSYTANSVVVTKGELFTSANNITRSAELSSKNTFKVRRLSATSYRIETGTKKAEINLVDMNGKLVKKINIGNYFTIVELPGMAKGVLVACNLSTNEKVKFAVY